MGTLETAYDRPRNLTIVNATGRLTRKDFLDWTKRYYSGTVTRFLVWDLTKADLSEISVGDVIDNVEYAAQVETNARDGRKTAIVADENWLAIALSKVGEVFVDKSRLPVQLQTFTTMDEAMEWLGVTGG